MKRESRTRTGNLHCRIDMTVFAGVLLVLLLILMIVTGPPYGGHGRLIELPKTRHAIPMPGADREDALIVAIQRDGKVFFDTTQVGPEDLVGKLKDRRRQGAPTPVFVKADGRARFRSVAWTVEEIRNAGMDRVVLLTEPRGQSRW